MTKADYYIVGVQTNSNREKIEQIKYRTKKKGNSKGMTRRKLIKEIKSGKIAYTMKNNNIQEKIKVTPIKNEDYLRINEKKIPEDNLGDIPKY